MKLVKYIVIWLIFALKTPINADNRIILYLKHAPENILNTVEAEAAQANLEERLSKIEGKMPGETSRKIAKYSMRKHIRPELSGFIGIYGGYMDISSRDGLISFPLRHSTPKIYIAVTPRINLINIKGNTFSHREFSTDEDNSTKLYSFELKKDEKQFTYWDIREEQIPADKKINPITLVILTNPKNLYIPTGHYLSVENPQLILPDIFVVDRIRTDQSILQVLDISRYFEAITIDKRKISDTSAQSMVTNL